jgi:hypothetical protein
MKAKDLTETISLPRPVRKAAKETAPGASGIGGFLSTLTRAQATPKAELPRHMPRRTAARARTRPASSPESSRVQAAPTGLLGRALAWFRTGVTKQSQLRLAETVSLGEKRFVAIIHVEGRKFLIGGGTAGVSLLTQLDETA